MYRKHVPSASLTALETFLVIASRDTPATISEVARATGSLLPVTSAALDLLENGTATVLAKNGEPPALIARVGNPVDARYKFAELTAKGAELALAMRALLPSKQDTPCDAAPPHTS
jgi:DNA-binding MarR family transcriptional regulator